MVASFSLPEVDAFFAQFEQPPFPGQPEFWLAWNIERAFRLLAGSQPLPTAKRPGSQIQPVAGRLAHHPPLVVDYPDFRLVVEVSVDSGVRQFERKGEVVTRRTGRIRLATSVSTPVYGIFVAPTIAPDTWSYFFGMNNIYIASHGGKAAILPLTVTQFRMAFTQSNFGCFNDPARLYELLNGLVQASQTLPNERDWQQRIDQALEVVLS